MRDSIHIGAFRRKPNFRTDADWDCMILEGATKEINSRKETGQQNRGCGHSRGRVRGQTSGRGDPIGPGRTRLR